MLRCLAVIASCLLSGGDASQPRRTPEASPLMCQPPDPQVELLAHWPLIDDARDITGNGFDAIPHHVDFHLPGPQGLPGTAAGFDGRQSWLEVPAEQALGLLEGDFTITAWINLHEMGDDVPGDLISRYDPGRRTGVHLGIKSSSSTSSQANDRQLQFGIDADHAGEWSDEGRPGNALLAFALCSFQGSLYAGTCEPGRDAAGRVYRYAGPDEWIDLGRLDGSNAVTSLAEFDGALYAGTGRYRVAGSSLPESENLTPGGSVFRCTGEGVWVSCGRLPEVEAIACLVVYQGDLYASSLYAPASLYRYLGGTDWASCPIPDGTRVEAMAVHDGYLYATSYDRGHVARYDGHSWTDCGHLGNPGENTQTYSLAVYQGELYCGTWPSGKVYRFDGIQRWTDVGRLGEELEVMGMLVHNGRLIAGTLPLAEVYEYAGDREWTLLTRLDHTPDVRYRRVWTMAEHQGRVYSSTLPSGHVHAWSAGSVAMSPRRFPSGWRHVAAVRSGLVLSLYLDGVLEQEVLAEWLTDQHFGLDGPLLIGHGPNASLCGGLSDVRIYRGGMSADAVRQLATENMAGK